MKLLFTHELHAVEHGGRFYNPAGVINYEALCNYLHTIRQGVVVLRCGRVEKVDPGWPRVDGPGVEVQPIPEFGRLGQFLKALPATVKAIWKAINRTDRHVLRLPGPTGALVGLVLLLRGRRYGVELAGHYEVEVLRELIRRRRLGPAWGPVVINWLIARLVSRAVAVGYRSRYLRSLYPSFRRDREYVFSGAVLKPEIVTGPREARHFAKRPFRVASIGRVGYAKGYPLLVRAFARARAQTDVPMELEIVGDGDEMPEVRQQVHALGLDGVVSLPGRVEWGPELFARLDGAHLFVLASLIDGMPRSVIEAMARGMPVISTTAGGIPELVDAQYLVPPGDEDALVAKIAALVGNTRGLAEMSRRSFERSKEHWPARLDRAKRGFWGRVVRYAR